MLRENLVDFEFSFKLFFVELLGLWYLDHNTRMDLVDK